MYHGNGFLAGRCVIPIRDEKSQLVAYAGRAVNREEPKYRFPAGFRKSQVLFNLDRAMQTGGNHVIVVEGFFDALKVHQAGFPAVVALMGASFSQRQSELLVSHFASVTLMLDGDEPGRRAAEVIVQLLMPKCLSTKWNCQTAYNRTNCRQRKSMFLLVRQLDLLTDSLQVSMGYPACLYDPVSYPNRAAVSSALSPKHGN